MNTPGGRGERGRGEGGRSRDEYNVHVLQLTLARSVQAEVSVKSSCL